MNCYIYMKILSFDVGIKNLAYCIIEKITDDEFKICDWGKINLNDQHFLCESMLKSNTKCTNKATHVYCENNIHHYLCKKHQDNYQEKNVSIEKKAGKCCYVNKKLLICNKKSDNFIENNFYCNQHVKSQITKLKKETSLQQINKINSNKIPIQVLTTKLLNILDNKKNFINVDEVLIENQPSFKNPTMKTISTLLYGYFCMRGIVEKDKNKSDIVNVKFCSPLNKMKLNNAQATIDENTKTKYKTTKNLAEIYCKALIADDVRNLKYINSESKKDDLADSFLQGFHYLYYKNSRLPDKFKNVLDAIKI